MAGRRAHHRAVIVRRTALDKEILYTVECHGGSYTAVVEFFRRSDCTKAPRLGVVVKDGKQMRKTSLREEIAAVVLPDAEKSFV